MFGAAASSTKPTFLAATTGTTMLPATVDGSLGTDHGASGFMVVTAAQKVSAPNLEPASRQGNLMKK